MKSGESMLHNIPSTVRLYFFLKSRLTSSSKRNLLSFKVCIVPLNTLNNLILTNSLSLIFLIIVPQKEFHVNIIKTSPAAFYSSGRKRYLRKHWLNRVCRLRRQIFRQADAAPRIVWKWRRNTWCISRSFRAKCDLPRWGEVSAKPTEGLTERPENMQARCVPRFIQRFLNTKHK